MIIEIFLIEEYRVPEMRYFVRRSLCSTTKDEQLRFFIRSAYYYSSRDTSIRDDNYQLFDIDDYINPAFNDFFRHTFPSLPDEARKSYCRGCYAHRFVANRLIKGMIDGHVLLMHNSGLYFKNKSLSRGISVIRTQHRQTLPGVGEKIMLADYLGVIKAGYPYNPRKTDRRIIVSYTSNGLIIQHPATNSYVKIVSPLEACEERFSVSIQRPDNDAGGKERTGIYIARTSKIEVTRGVIDADDLPQKGKQLSIIIRTVKYAHKDADFEKSPSVSRTELQQVSENTLGGLFQFIYEHIVLNIPIVGQIASVGEIAFKIIKGIKDGVELPSVGELFILGISVLVPQAKNLKVLDKILGSAKGQALRKKLAKILPDDEIGMIHEMAAVIKRKGRPGAGLIGKLKGKKFGALLDKITALSELSDFTNYNDNGFKNAVLNRNYQAYNRKRKALGLKPHTPLTYLKNAKIISKQKEQIRKSAKRARVKKKNKPEKDKVQANCIDCRQPLRKLDRKIAAKLFKRPYSAILFNSYMESQLKSWASPHKKGRRACLNQGLKNNMVGAIAEILALQEFGDLILKKLVLPPKIKNPVLYYGAERELPYRHKTGKLLKNQISDGFVLATPYHIHQNNLVLAWIEVKANPEHLHRAILQIQNKFSEALKPLADGKKISFLPCSSMELGLKEKWENRNILNYVINENPTVRLQANYPELSGFKKAFKFIILPKLSTEHRKLLVNDIAEGKYFLRGNVKKQPVDGTMDSVKVFEMKYSIEQIREFAEAVWGLPDSRLYKAYNNSAKATVRPGHGACRQTIKAPGRKPPPKKKK